jgi:hypothetical protein
MKESQDQALTTPLSFTGSAEELDSEFGRHLASYVDWALVELVRTEGEFSSEVPRRQPANTQRSCTERGEKMTLRTGLSRSLFFHREAALTRFTEE